MFTTIGDCYDELNSFVGLLQVAGVNMKEVKRIQDTILDSMENRKASLELMMALSLVLTVAMEKAVPDIKREG